MKKTNDLFLKELKEKNINIIPLEEYKGGHTPILCKCLNCNIQWKVLPANLLVGKGCPECKKKKLSSFRLNDTSTFIEKALKIHGDKYNYSKVNYINAKTKVIIICSEHGEFQQTPSDHLLKKGCPKCAKNIKYNTKDWIELAKIVHGDKYDYSMVEYNESHDKVKIECPIHGVFLQRPTNHLTGLGCPKCKSSKGEQYIEKILKNKNIIYIPLYLINIDTDINPSGKAYIDFFIPHYNLFIEYNGEQHYISKTYFGGELRLNIQLKRDEFIRTYCKLNNITLLEIPYNKSQEEIIKLINSILYE